jgi:hypothetical protein
MRKRKRYAYSAKTRQERVGNLRATPSYSLLALAVRLFAN